MRTLTKILLREPLEWSLYRADSPPVPTVSDLAIQVVQPGGALAPDHAAFLRHHLKAGHVLLLAKALKRGNAWGFFAQCEGRPAFYGFALRSSLFRRDLPAMTEHDAWLVGPCFTAAEFRDRAIYHRMLLYIIHYIYERKFGPLYRHVETVNVPGCRRLMKAGFAFVGSWRVSRDPLSLLSASRRLALLAYRPESRSRAAPLNSLDAVA